MQLMRNNCGLTERRSSTQLYEECPVCRTWAFGYHDAYCSRCGAKLDEDGRIAGINDYAKALLLDFLNGNPDLAMEIDIGEIPDHATEAIQANGHVLFNQYATRRIIAECWNEVETALDDWRDGGCDDFPISNIERLHVFSVTRHAEIIWRDITHDMHEDYLCDETLAEAVERLECL